jgi:putative tryptophan/tyrosine transport system substrate-binding protein
VSRDALLVNPAEATNTEATLKDMEAAAPVMGIEIKRLNASSSREINAAFATLVQERPDAIFVGVDAFYTARRVQLALLAMLHRIAVIYPVRPFVEAMGRPSSRRAAACGGDTT